MRGFIICTLHRIHQWKINSRTMRWAGHVEIMGEIIHVYEILFEDLRVRVLRRWKDCVKVCLEKSLGVCALNLLE
jgi:hypothetical protein